MSEVVVASPAEKQRDETSVIAALIDVLDAGQRVVLDRIELASVEARAAARSIFASLVLVLFGLAFLVVGWCAANAVGVLVLSRYWTQPQAIGLVALINFVAGGVALLLARQQSQGLTSNDMAERGRAEGGAERGTMQ